MANALMPVLVILLLALLAITSLPKIKSSKRSEKDDIDVTAESNDAELVGSVTVKEDVTYPGIDEMESGAAVFLFETRYPDGQPKVKKWILSRQDSAYLTMSGHHIVYEYFREDGSLSMDRMVHPDSSLNRLSVVKERKRYFDEDEKQLRAQYLRTDGSLAHESDYKTGLYREFRQDGKTLRSLHYPPTETGQKSIWYKRDGKTVWMEKDETGNMRAYFDLKGNACDLRFTRTRLVGGYSMGPSVRPFLTSYDDFHREDGTLAYRQYWWTRWDEDADTSVDTLGSVAVFDETGMTQIAEYTLQMQSADKPLFITQAVHLTVGEPTLVRKYRVPGNRESEQLVSKNGVEIEKTIFDSFDRFQESVDAIVFQAFIRDVWGIRDDESHDI